MRLRPTMRQPEASAEREESMDNETHADQHPLKLTDFDHTALLNQPGYLKLRDALGDLRDFRDQHPGRKGHLTLGEILDIVTECVLTTQCLDACVNCDSDSDNWPIAIDRYSKSYIEADHQCRDCGHRWKTQYAVDEETNRTQRF